MEPVAVIDQLRDYHDNFYPQAPHGACRIRAKVLWMESNNFYPQAPHGACLQCFFGYFIACPISILRLRMEPVRLQPLTPLHFHQFLSSGSAWSLSRHNLQQFLTYVYFYPQAPHGACRCWFRLLWLCIQFLSSGSAWSLSAKNTKNMSYSHSVFLQHYQ